MGLSMIKLLNKYNDCDMFSLTGNAFGYNIKDEEFLNAVSIIKNNEKKHLNEEYNSKLMFEKYSDFEVLYSEVEKECYDYFNSLENREYYINMPENLKEIKRLQKKKVSLEEINRYKRELFSCSYIVDGIGESTKYGRDNEDFFYHLYSSISTNIDRINSKDDYCINCGENIIDQVPNELKDYLLYYEVSFYNSVTTSSGLMINYYFKLNNETRKYLLKYKNDFSLNELEDLILYKDGKEMFYSCTHERFNSINFDYKSMSKDDIIDFINDEYPNQDNDIIINIINKLIKMDSNVEFTFRKIGIKNNRIKEKVCTICDNLNLLLFAKNENSNCYEDIDCIEEIPAIFCKLDDLIIKK